MDENKIFAIFKKLPKQDKNTYKLKKVKLSLKDDLEECYEEFRYAYEDAVSGIDFMEDWIERISSFKAELSNAVDNYVINGAVGSLEEYTTELKTKLETLELGARDLGLEPSEIWNWYDEARTDADDADLAYKEFLEKYREVVNDSNNGLNDFL